MNSRSLDQEVSGKNNISICPRDQSCVILAKNGAAFLLLSKKKNLSGAKLKSFTLRTLTEEISKQPNIDHIAWLLVASLSQIYNERSKLIKKQYKMYKGDIRKCTRAKS